MQPVSGAQEKPLRVKPAELRLLPAVASSSGRFVRERGELRSHAGLGTILSFYVTLTRADTRQKHNKHVDPTDEPKPSRVQSVNSGFPTTFTNFLFLRSSRQRIRHTKPYHSAFTLQIQTTAWVWFVVK